MRLRAAGLLWTKVGEEVVLLDQRSEMYLGVNPAGAALWDLLVAGCDRADLIRQLQSEWGIDAQAAAHDVDAFLDDLRAEALLDENDA